MPRSPYKGETIINAIRYTNVPKNPRHLAMFGDGQMEKENLPNYLVYPMDFDIKETQFSFFVHINPDYLETVQSITLAGRPSFPFPPLPFSLTGTLYSHNKATGKGRK